MGSEPNGAQTKSVSTSFRLSAKEVASADYMAKRLGIRRNDYLMLLIRCRPEFISPEPGSVDFYDMARAETMLITHEEVRRFDRQSRAAIDATMLAGMAADHLLANFERVRARASFDAGAWLVGIRTRLTQLDDTAFALYNLAGKYYSAYSHRHLLRANEWPRHKRPAYRLRCYPAELAALDAAANARGMTRNDYLCMLLAARPSFKAPAALDAVRAGCPWPAAPAPLFLEHPLAGATAAALAAQIAAERLTRDLREIESAAADGDSAYVNHAASKAQHHVAAAIAATEDLIAAQHNLSPAPPMLSNYSSRRIYFTDGNKKPFE